MKKKRCKKGEHQPMRGGKRERCTKCGDVFPCRNECEHIDCILESGRELPDWVTVRDRATNLEASLGGELCSAPPVSSSRKRPPGSISTRSSGSRTSSPPSCARSRSTSRAPNPPPTKRGPMSSESKAHRHAYQKRARDIGILGSCICTYPNDVFATVSGHDARCPADEMQRYYDRVLKEGTMPKPVTPERLRAYALEMNRIADAAFLCSQGMVADQLSEGLVDEVRTSAARMRGLALRLEELAHHLEVTR
jgi:hypothetical protein